MKFVYGKQDLRTLQRAQENHMLLTNGLGGYASLTLAFSAVRCDQGVLIGAVSAPNVRAALVHRIRERLAVGGRQVFLSTQEFAGRGEPEDGYRHLSAFVSEYDNSWTYDVRGVRVVRAMAMAREKNAVAVIYDIDNRSGEAAQLTLMPMMLMAPKGNVRTRKVRLSFDGRRIAAGGYAVYMKTDGEAAAVPERWERLRYADDAKDGRPGSGLCGGCFEIRIAVPAGARVRRSVVFSMEDEDFDAEKILRKHQRRAVMQVVGSGMGSPVACQLALAADAFFSRKEATGGVTLLAGFPLFGDWGRDTMIALPGCALTTGRLLDARSILRTFLAYEKDGLVPNLFPEGGAQPMYNTADAALLLVNTVHQYMERAQDAAFLAEAWPVMKRIIAAYERGTRHGIRMDADGLIMAGEGYDQVTWMDVRVGDILPTPRHGKPVELNAYWYSALRIMERYAPSQGEDGAAYGALASRVKSSFIRAFYMEEKGYLRDVISGTEADAQLRCNQIWALTMPYTMLAPEQEARVVEAVGKHLYTPCGLRTLSPDDPQYRGTYGGSQLERDLAYHQGTAWVFPLGAYIQAVMKVRGPSRETVRDVRAMLEPVEAMLREGCVGQLPEIYEGDMPGESKGCFAQAWSVGEMLRAYEVFEEMERVVGRDEG